MPDRHAISERISLRRDEAVRRGRQLRIQHTLIELDLRGALSGPSTGALLSLSKGSGHQSGHQPGFTSTTTIRFVCREPGSDTFVEFAGAELNSVELNGRPLDPATWAEGRIPLAELAEENTVIVRGRMAYSDDGEGLHRHVDPVDGRTYLYAMSFLNAAPRWFACFDQPDLKGTYVLHVQGPADWTVLGNGPSVNTGPGHWRIVPTAPLSTYFVTLVAGPYSSLYDQHGDVRLGLHVRSSLASHLQDEATDVFAVTKAGFDYYHRVFGVSYPFGEYHQAFVPDFNAGAMENPGCVTLRDQFIYRSRATAAERATRAGVLTHELAHMWFGDLVTMRWWDDLWLNESFAEYMAHRCCTEATRYELWTEFGILRKDWGMVADQAPSTHPVAGNGAADALSALQDFDGISYAKGAAVLKQLAAHLGDDVFFGGLRDHFGVHAFGNADFADLISAWNRAGARRLDAWAAAWLRTAGLDTLSVVDGQIRRTSSTPVPRPHAVQVASFDASGRELTRNTITITDDPVDLDHVPPSALTVPDAADETWAKIRFGRPWPAVIAIAQQIPLAPVRVVVGNAMRDAVRDGELDPVEALAGLFDLVRTETSEIVIGSLLRFAADQLCGPYLPPPDRPGALARVHDVARQLLDAAAPESDRQLAAFRVAVRSSADEAALRRWLDRRGLPPGLDLDTELAWAVVDRLAVLTVDPDVIGRQLAGDPSAAGRSHAAQARASLADPAAKEAAWRLLMQPSTLGAYELYATATGFFQPSQDELCAPYAVRYFDEIGGTAAFRSGWALGQIALYGYPSPHAEPTILTRAETCLAGTDLAVPLRRSIVDGTDKLRRAVTSRTRFTGDSTRTDATDPPPTP